MVAKVKYTPIGDAISPESTFVQAAIALDVAAQFAVESRDTEGMNRTAELWIEMAKALMDIDEETGPPTERERVGFRQPDITTEEDEDGRRIDADEPDGSPSEGESRLHQKHGKFRISKTRYRTGD